MVLIICVYTAVYLGTMETHHRQLATTYTSTQNRNHNPSGNAEKPNSTIFQVDFNFQVWALIFCRNIIIAH